MQDGFFTLEHTERRKEELLAAIFGGGAFAARQLSHKRVGEVARSFGVVWLVCFWQTGECSPQDLEPLCSFIVEEGCTDEGTGGDSWGYQESVAYSSIPAKVSKSISQTWILFTDGAYEPTSDIPASIGGVLGIPSGQKLFNISVSRLIRVFFPILKQRPITLYMSWKCCPPWWPQQYGQI